MAEAIANLPWMDERGLACFMSAMRTCRCFLEYGCGGSTAYAVNTAGVPVVISVDTSAQWVAKVRATVTGSGRLLLNHCDVGEVGEWGTPLNSNHIADFWRYMALPWQVARKHHLVPDTVLIDGRFRVASFLYSLLAARPGTTLLFDDYFDRPEYFVVEEFCPIREQHGRMALFIADRQFSVIEICARIAQYSINWD